MKRLLSAAAALCIAATMIGNNVSAADMSDYVRMNENVSYAMTSAQYWINKTDDAGRVLRTPEEIAAINAQNPPTENVGDYNVSLYDMGDTIDGGFVRAIFDEISAPADPSQVFLNGKPTTEEYWEKLIDNADASSVPDTVNVRFGYSTARSSLRTFPSYDFIGEDKDDRFYDVMVMSEYMPFRPLAVLHESKDKQWYYVMFDGYSGWVNKKYVALCPDREDWLARMQPEDFLVVTGKEIRLQDDVRCPALSGQIIPMGTVLPLVKKADAPAFINDRETTACYITKLPVRGADGMITDRYSLISIKEDVNIGYLEYTSENVLKLAFKRLGDRYGWAGLGRSNDCSGITCEIFRCFGLRLPRVSGQIAAFEGADTRDVSGMTDAQKKALLESVPAGSVLYFRGHIMIYLGMYDDTPYCMSAAGTYLDTDGDVYEANSVIISDMEATCRKDGKTWLSDLEKVITM